jgi:outer membrane receptor for ferrienterochelin and colicin
MDITLRSELTDHIEIAASLYNVFDHRYSDPGSAEHVQDALLQNERSVLFRIDYWL